MILLATLFLPLATAAVLLWLPSRTLRHGALAGAIATLVLALVAVDYAVTGHVLSIDAAWAPAAGIGLRLEADGVSALLVLLNALLFLLAIVATRLEQIGRPRLFLVLMLLTETGATGVVLARDLVLFYVFWEAVLIPLFILISAFGEGSRQYAALRLLIFSGLGSLAMLLSILTIHAATGAASFALADLAHAHLSAGPLVFGLSAADLAFLGFALAFAIKAPLVPLHGWLADAYTSAPAPVVMVLAGIVSKLGPYGFFRVGLALLPGPAARFQPLLMTLAAIGIVYGALLALRQTDAKRMVAYLSLSHMCFITLGIVSVTAAGLTGGVLQMLNHGVLIAGLFFVVDHLEHRIGTRRVGQVSGLSSRGRGLAALFLVLSLATLGLPGLNGFVGEYQVMFGTFLRSGALLALAAAGVVLAAWYTLRLYQGLMNGAPVDGPSVEVGDRELVVLVPLCALAVVIGVYPAPLLDLAGRAVAALTGGGG
jgi:NADH-quinone oxidoreductase subunit M